MTSFPISYSDFIFIQVLAAVPLCWMMLQMISKSVQMKLTFSAIMLALIALVSESLWKPIISELPQGYLLTWQFLIATPVAWVLTSLYAIRSAQKKPVPTKKVPIRLFACVSILALAVPVFYQSERINDTLTQLSQLQSESRLGEFNIKSQALLEVAPKVKLHEEELNKLFEFTRDQERELKLTVERMPEGFEQSKLLAILGDRQSAAQRLQSNFKSRDATTQEALLLGTIYEHDQNWPLAAQWYNEAKDFAEKNPKTPRPLLLAALKGIGFSQRKQNNNKLAEQAYQQLLALDRSADSHFLLAKFYQDSQAGEKASFHLKKAVYLGGDRFKEQAEEINFHLRSYQFGCFRIH